MLGKKYFLDIVVVEARHVHQTGEEEQHVVPKPVLPEMVSSKAKQLLGAAQEEVKTPLSSKALSMLGASKDVVEASKSPRSAADGAAAHDHQMRTYVSLRLGTQRFVTRGSPSSLPTWNEDCTFTFRGLGLILYVLVYTINRHKRRNLVGSLTIDVSSIEEGKLIDTWYPLRLRHQEGIQISEVESRCSPQLYLMMQLDHSLWWKSFLSHRGQPLARFPFRVSVGDILVMSSNAFVSHFAKVAQRSKWDHAAMIVTSSNGRLRMLESVTDGVRVLDLERALPAYAAACRFIGIRRADMARTPEVRATIREFATRVRGKQYNFSLVQMLKQQKKERVEDKYFCSQLVAACYIDLGWLPADNPSSNYLPAAFGDPHLRMNPGCSMSDLKSFSCVPDQWEMEHEDRLRTHIERLRSLQEKAKLLARVKKEADLIRAQERLTRKEIMSSWRQEMVQSWDADREVAAAVSSGANVRRMERFFGSDFVVGGKKSEDPSMTSETDTSASSLVASGSPVAHVVADGVDAKPLVGGSGKQDAVAEGGVGLTRLVQACDLSDAPESQAPPSLAGDLVGESVGCDAGEGLVATASDTAMSQSKSKSNPDMRQSQERVQQSASPSDEDIDLFSSAKLARFFGTPSRAPESTTGGGGPTARDHAQKGSRKQPHAPVVSDTQADVGLTPDPKLLKFFGPPDATSPKKGAAAVERKRALAAALLQSPDPFDQPLPPELVPCSKLSQFFGTPAVPAPAPRVAHRNARDHSANKESPTAAPGGVQKPHHHSAMLRRDDQSSGSSDGSGGPASDGDPDGAALAEAESYAEQMRKSFGVMMHHLRAEQAELRHSMGMEIASGPDAYIDVASDSGDEEEEDDEVADPLLTDLSRRQSGFLDVGGGPHATSIASAAAAAAVAVAQSSWFPKIDEVDGSTE